jgi:hypothetical protein
MSSRQVDLGEMPPSRSQSIDPASARDAQNTVLGIPRDAAGPIFREP